jgi:hypothetical protein
MTNLRAFEPPLVEALRKLAAARNPKEVMRMDPGELSRRRFTDAAQRVVRHISERVMDRGMVAGELTEATAGMLAILSILRWERKVALTALERLGTDLDKLARDVDAAIEAEGRSSRQPDGTEFDARSWCGIDECGRFDPASVCGIGQAWS